MARSYKAFGLVAMLVLSMAVASAWADAGVEAINKSQTCAAGQTKCKKTCVNLQTDANNCGACKTVCSGSTPSCVAGKCVAKAPATIAADAEEVNKAVTCTAPLTKCKKSCVNLQTDAMNCGACKTKCTGSTPKCVAGKCSA